MENVHATKTIVATVAYLIGLPKDRLEGWYREEASDTLDALYTNETATKIRYICKLRTAMLQNFVRSDELLRGLDNLHKQEFYDHDSIAWLEKHGVPILKTNYRTSRYLEDFNKYLAEHINECKDLFGTWIKWEYIRSLFVVPNYNDKKTAIAEYNKYKKCKDVYPFQCYIYWNPTKLESISQKRGKDIGYVLATDGKFLNVLYALNNDTFTDRSKYLDADESTRSGIYNFIDEASKVAIVVDCENADIFKLYSTLKSLNAYELSKVEKIVLYDDVNTTAAWCYLGTALPIPVEYVEVERVTDRKSLVDTRMTAGICSDYYKEQITSFILVSSDSDFWGVISALQGANFLVMNEYEKRSQDIVTALEYHGITYCSLDDFCTAGYSDFKTSILLSELEKKLPEILGANGLDLARSLFTENYIPFTESELTDFYNRYIRTLSLKMGADGTFYIDIKRQ